MTSKQQLVAFIGVFLIGLTIWQHWRGELSVILFNNPTLSTLTTPGANGSKPSVDQFGNLDPNGQYSVQAPTPGVGNPNMPTIVPNIP